MADSKRGRRKKTVAELKASGNYRADRNGYGPPKIEGGPRKPNTLTGRASEFWDWVVPPLEQAGVVSLVDSAELATMCEFWQDYRELREEVPEHGDALTRIAEAVERIADNEDMEAAEAVLDKLAKVVEGYGRRRDSRARAMQSTWRAFSDIAKRFGLAPQDRQKLSEAEPKEDNPFEQFLARGKN